MSPAAKDRTIKVALTLWHVAQGVRLPADCFVFAVALFFMDGAAWHRMANTTPVELRMTWEAFEHCMLEDEVIPYSGVGHKLEFFSGAGNKLE